MHARYVRRVYYVHTSATATRRSGVTIVSTDGRTPQCGRTLRGSDLQELTCARRRRRRRVNLDSVESAPAERRRRVDQERRPGETRPERESIPLAARAKTWRARILRITMPRNSGARGLIISRMCQ
ncbi:hypothetical protein ALC56_15194 [Trachymyrmex septentrionalis]|uniref:Uncharacterized protein n=1 Tax=Trachymyrmex septentrionalis TaxID=34720 RepID=A0A195EQK7_9HYME|nr:hypothetical protein ALC56_15194 [Trachymyrmex septentrionalis]